MATEQQERSGAVEWVRRAAWRSRLSARAPRLLAAALASVLIVAGLRAILAGSPGAPPRTTVSVSVDAGAEAFAEAFVHSYLSWDASAPERQQDAVSRYVVKDLDIGVGVEQRQAQSVLWTVPLGSELRAGRWLVSIEAATDRGSYRVVVPVARDDRGQLAVVDYPALVGAAVTSASRDIESRREVEDSALRTVAARAVRNYLAGERADLLADLDSAAVVSLPERPLRVESIDAVEWVAPRRVAVRVSASDVAAAFVLSYELAVVWRGRWYVRVVGVNPTHPSQRSR